MVKLEEYKAQSEEKQIEKLPLPPKVYIPLIQHLGKTCDTLKVNIGDSVVVGQKLAIAAAHVFSPLHASISGKVVALQDWPHPVLGRAKALVIESDGLDKSQILNPKFQTEIDKLNPNEIRNIVFEAGIVGMGGAGFPTHIKLTPPKHVDTLIINGAECEPFLTSDYRLMLEKTQEILLGVDLVARCLGIKNVYIAIEDNKPEAIEKFKIQNPPAQSTKTQAGSRPQLQEMRREKSKIIVLKSQYPQGGEKQLIKNILGKEVPSGKLPFDIGVVVQNVATVFAIYEAVYQNKPLYERVVTVTGSCISNPKNLLVRIGTPIKDLVEYCAPLKEEPAKIIIGGPMMGIAQYTDLVPVIKTTGGVILLNKKEAKSQEEITCIRCGACIRECPVNLMPCLINLASEKGFWPQAESYRALDCIECGICNYVCPANRNLVQSIKRAKLEAAR